MSVGSCKGEPTVSPRAAYRGIVSQDPMLVSCLLLTPPTAPLGCSI